MIVRSLCALTDVNISKRIEQILSKNIVCIVFHFIVFFFRVLRILDASAIKKREKDKRCSKHGRPRMNSNSSSSEDSINLIDENNLYWEEGNAQKNGKAV